MDKSIRRLDNFRRFHKNRTASPQNALGVTSTSADEPLQPVWHYGPRNANGVLRFVATPDDARIGTTTMRLSVRVPQHGRARSAVPQAILLTKTAHIEGCARRHRVLTAAAAYWIRRDAKILDHSKNGKPKKKKPPSFDGGFSNSSLTMSYFHTGTRTIIGAEAFHCPVRDGKEWDHLAMVIRLNRSPSCKFSLRTCKTANS